MKAIKFLLLIIITSSFTLFQKTEFKIQDFEKMTKMNANDFETYILNRGFEFEKTVNLKSFDVVYYKKKNAFISKSVSTELPLMYSVFYETSSKTEYLNLKKQAEILGYKYKKTDDQTVNSDNSYHNIYVKGDMKLDFFISSRNENLGYYLGIDFIKN